MRVVTLRSVLVVCLALGRLAAAEAAAWTPLLESAEQALAIGDSAAAERDWLAAEREIRAANDQRALAQVCFDLGNLYARSGRLSDAITRFEISLGLYETNVGPRHPDTLASLANLAAAQRDAGNSAEAARLAERVRKSLDGRGLPPDATLAQALNTLGNLAMESGDYARAVSLYQRVVRTQNEEYRASDAEKRTVLENLAHAQERAGDNEGAQATLALLQGNASGAARADLLERSAEQQRKSGALDAARVGLRDAASLREQAGEGAAAALDRVLLAELEQALGDSAPAERELRRALAHPACPSDVAARAGEIAAALAAQHAKAGTTDHATRLYEMSAEALARGKGGEHQSVASSLFNLGVLAYNAGDDAQARREFARALAIWRRSLPAGDPKLAQLEGLFAELDQNDRADAGETPDVGAGGAD